MSQECTLNRTSYVQKSGGQILKPAYNPSTELKQHLESKEQHRQNLVEGFYLVFEAGHMSAIEALEILERVQLKVKANASDLNQAYVSAKRIRG
ncbi:hypothetical protein [Dehalobacter restrictus]|uniref:hypothetical protein n=1 Tax=Dehalobacter restrictus TaxID=55583 RepID=UPI00338E3BCB